MHFKHSNFMENGKLQQMRPEKETGVRNDFSGPANGEQGWG